MRDVMVELYQIKWLRINPTCYHDGKNWIFPMPTMRWKYWMSKETIL